MQVNGRDVANKEETESLFAENRKAVTLLVSRCLNKVMSLGAIRAPLHLRPSFQSDECIDAEPAAAYQNSIIEQVVQQTEAQPPARGEPGPRVPPHCPDRLNLTNSLVRSKIDSINHEISELDQRMQSIQLVKLDKRRPPQLPHVPAPPDSDTEHIYETIPESADSDPEPIYSSPYDGGDADGDVIARWLKAHEGGWREAAATAKEAKSQENKAKSKSSKSSSGEEHENSSSAYNTGGSCNSNPLTCELACGAQKDAFRSTLVLCPPPPEAEPEAAACELCRQQGKKKKKPAKAASPQSPTRPALLLGDTMYTNVANLQQTMLLQQQLFRQALEVGMKPSTSFTAPSLTQYQFVGGQRVRGVCFSSV